MKRYMVIYVIDGEQGVSFVDTFNKAQDIHMNVECGMGGYAEVYERVPVYEEINGAQTTTVVAHEYQLLYA